jgi:YVTN family beta-propeller protein
MLFGINATGAHSVSRIIHVNAAAGVTLTHPGAQTSNVGTPSSLQINATAPAGTTLVYSASGLPAGLSMNAALGLISGTPTTSGIFSVTVTAAGGGLTSTQNFTWTTLLSNTGSGTILREWWTGINGGILVSDLTSSASYPNSPTGSSQLTSFETPTDWADNMGQRVRGYIHPPVTGQYRFWIASDDEGQLRLSTNRDPANVTLIAGVPQWSGPREWNKFPQQTSSLITLQAGQSYYVEALMKEGAGADNLAIAWATPGSSTPVVIEGQYLSPWVNNSPPLLSNPGNRVHVIGSPLNVNLIATDANNDPLTYSASALPTGLSINTNTGIITGTPTATGTFNSTVRVTDGRSPGVSATFVWTINLIVNLNPPIASPPSTTGVALNYTSGSTGGANVRYKWSWGDGTADTAFSSNPAATHTFASPGRYQITITATDDSGGITTSTFYQGIHAPLSTLRPTSSSSIAIEDRPAGTNDRVWCVNPDNDSVTVFDAVTRARIAEINVGTAPRALAIAPDGRVWVSNVESSTVSIINPSTLTVVQTLTLARAARPFGIAFDPDGTDGWIACEGTGLLLRMNPTTGAQSASLNVGLNARHLSVTANSSRVLVSRFITPPLPGENTATINNTDQTGGEVISVLTSTLAIEKTTILTHSTRADSITTGRGIPNYLGPAVISPDGLTAWVPSKQDNIKRGTLRDGSQLTHDQTVRSVASRIVITGGIAANTDDMLGRVDFDNAGIASNGTFERTGLYFFTALEGSREIGVVDVWGKKEIKRFSAGRAPQAVVTSPDGRTVYVHNFMDRTITVHDVGPLLDGADATPTLTATLNCVTTERLSAPILLGKQHFYDATDSRIAFQQYISCASCHNDGAQDGRTWDFTGFGEGLRNTITLRGHGGTAHGPLHWTNSKSQSWHWTDQWRKSPSPDEHGQCRSQR